MSLTIPRRWSRAYALRVSYLLNQTLFDTLVTPWLFLTRTMWSLSFVCNGLGQATEPRLFGKRLVSAESDVVRHVGDAMVILDPHYVVAFFRRKWYAHRRGIGFYRFAVMWGELVQGRA